MNKPGAHELTELLEAWSDGEQEALGGLSVNETAEVMKIAPITPEEREAGWGTVLITAGDRQLAHPELSPDGTRFVMRMLRRTQDDIVVVNRDGTNWRDLTNDRPFDSLSALVARWKEDRIHLGSEWSLRDLVDGCRCGKPASAYV